MHHYILNTIYQVGYTFLFPWKNFIMEIEWYAIFFYYLSSMKPWFQAFSCVLFVSPFNKRTRGKQTGKLIPYQITKRNASSWHYTTIHFFVTLYNYSVQVATIEKKRKKKRLKGTFWCGRVKPARADSLSLPLGGLSSTGGCDASGTDLVPPFFSIDVMAHPSTPPPAKRWLLASGAS